MGVKTLEQTTEMQERTGELPANNLVGADDIEVDDRRQMPARKAPVFDRSQRRFLLILSGFSLIAGYQGTIVTAIFTYAADGWNVSLPARGRTLAALRADIVITLVVVAIADRIGRRKTIIGAAVLSAMFTVVSALSTGLWVFATMQFVGRGLNTAVAVLVAVFVAENLPKTSRAWGSALMVAAAAVGSAITLVFSSQADRSPQWWRIVAIPSALFLLLSPVLTNGLRESARFAQVTSEFSPQQKSRMSRTAFRKHIKQLTTLALFSALFAFEVAPSRQLQNDFLRKQHHFTSAAVSIFSVLSNAPGIIGLFAGGRLSDRLGRKKLIGLGVIGFAIGDAGMFLSSGLGIWVFSMLGAAIGGMSLAPMAVLPAESFPTAIRAKADGFSTAAGRLGGAAGVLFVGEIADKTKPGPVLALTSIALWLSLVALSRIPETANRELVELADAVDPIGEPANAIT
jgi:MFS transporter, AAHS family, benzoate transport protein